MMFMWPPNIVGGYFLMTYLAGIVFGMAVWSVVDRVKGKK